MAETLDFELVSPQKLVLSEPVEMVSVPGSEGYFGALPHHAPMIAMMRPGVLDLYKGGAITRRIFVAGGFAEVTETRCTVLAQEAIDLAKISAEQAQDRLSAAKEARQRAFEPADIAETEAKLVVAQALLDVLKF